MKYENQILIGDVLEQLALLPDQCVQTCVTSPPYWGLRDYGVEGQIGLEKTPEEYTANMVKVFREVRRVLRDDGTLWLNLGDSYNAYNHNRGPAAGYNKNHASIMPAADRGLPVQSLKAKDLLGMPWRVAFALQAGGWYLRSDIIWSKPNPMPESVTDRPTKAHEYVFLMTKKPKYYYDAEAIKETASYDGKQKSQPRGDFAGKGGAKKGLEPFRAVVEYRNRRTVWEISTHSYPEAHFATFPEKLVEPCILAGTSSAGCCSNCGSPLRRMLNKNKTGFQDADGKWRSTDNHSSGRRLIGRVRAARAAGGSHDNPFPPAKTVGWKARCECDAGIAPCIVLDPFIGSGTVALVALKAGHKFVGIELNPAYAAMARKRISQEQSQMRLL